MTVFSIVMVAPLALCPAQPTPPAKPPSQPVFDASALREPRALASAWLVRSGDDPSYARPDFDDSQWQAFDPKSSITTLLSHEQPRVVWYRLRVKVDPSQTGLALTEWNISRAFEIYANGQRLLASGQVAPYIPHTSVARLLIPIPDKIIASGTILIALRVYIAPVEWSGQDPGFYATNLIIGQRETLYRYNWLTVVSENALDWLEKLLGISVGLVALILFAAQRRQKEYLWIFAVGALSLAEAPLPLLTTFHNVPAIWEIPAALPRLVSPFIFASLYFTFVHQRIGWRWRIILLIAGIMNFVSALNGSLFRLPLPVQFLVSLPMVALLSLVIPVILGVHWLRGNRDAGILLIPVILFSLYIYAEVGLETLFQFPAWRDTALHGLNLIDRYPAGPFAVSLNTLSGILSTITLAFIMLERSTTMSRRQAILEGELAAAQEVQQVLLPEQIPAVSGFAIESVYQPAQQVGGDFFQILPAGEGGLLVVVGDVAGKGLPAAMLVSVLVGAIRGVADYTLDPAELLANLNERLVGRAGGGFSTALVAHIAAGGAVEIANAGHLSPYLDGEEVELPGALPLGVASGTTYETTTFYLPAGSRLTFYSDGVVEAQNRKGELLGFERSRELSTRPATDIVEAARQFGQQDDITVVTIERKAAIATAA